MNSPTLYGQNILIPLQKLCGWQNGTRQHYETRWCSTTSGGESLGTSLSDEAPFINCVSCHELKQQYLFIRQHMSLQIALWKWGNMKRDLSLVPRLQYAKPEGEGLASFPGTLWNVKWGAWEQGLGLPVASYHMIRSTCRHHMSSRFWVSKVACLSKFVCLHVAVYRTCSYYRLKVVMWR